LLLPAELHTQMWSRVLVRLRQGEPLLTTGQFEQALVVAYQQLVDDEPLPASARRQLRELVHQLHSEYPETYLAQGMQNAVRQAFATGIDRLAWSHEEIERNGWQVIRRFLRSDRMRDLLTDIQLDPRAIDAANMIRHVLESRRLDQPSAAATTAAASVPPATVPAEEWTEVEEDRPVRSAAVAAKPQLHLAMSLAAKEAGIDEQVAAERIQEQEELRVVLAQKEMAHVADSLSVFVADGLLDATQAEQMSALLAIDAGEGEGEIDATEAESQRSAILTVDRRRDLQARVRTAVDSTVGYIQVFESLKKISKTYDSLLKLLVQHKKAVVDDNAGDRNTLLGTLSKSPELLKLATGMMDRTDAEVRLLAVRLPPYNQLVPYKLKPIANLTVDKAFISDLRSCSADELSARFRDADPLVRAKPAADILTLIHLLDHVTEPTPFRMKLRMLLVNQVLLDVRPRLEELFATGDPAESRRKAERVLRQRLDRHISGASREEKAAAQRRWQAVLLALEQKVVADAHAGAAAVEEALKTESVKPVTHDESLTEEERHLGVQLTRVEIRVAGQGKKIPTKIMPDPEDPSRQLVVRRDPETGELGPQMRRGKKHYVEQGRDGVWRTA
jgi:hypothetical protein